MIQGGTRRRLKGATQALETRENPSIACMGKLAASALWKLFTNSNNRSLL